MSDTYAALPSLNYLLIFNPAITCQDEDEDERERAQLLFYSAREQAVSKDRILRQLGVAKALSKFSAIFDSRGTCDSVHSQNRRMIIFSPEPNFWMQACFELGRVSRKKGAKLEDKKQVTVFEADESSLHDAALKMRMQLGYEAFKLRHGSLSSVMDTLGKEALELQLERFFTVWCWSWDFGKENDLVDYIGIPVHPQSKQLLPVIEQLGGKIPSRFLYVFLTSSYVLSPIPAPSKHLVSLLRHLMNIARTKPSRNTTGHAYEPAMSDLNDTIHAGSTSTDAGDSLKSDLTNKKFMGIPMTNLNMNVHMNTGKWLWQNYIPKGSGFPSFGLRSKADGSSDDGTSNTTIHEGHEVPSLQESKDTPVDESANSNASQTDCSTPEERNVYEKQDFINVPQTSDISTSMATGDTLINDVPDGPQHGPKPESLRERDSSTKFPLLGNEEAETKVEESAFSEFHAYISDPSEPCHPPRRKRIRYRLANGIIFALIPTEDGADALDDNFCQRINQDVSQILAHVVETMETLQSPSLPASSSPIQAVLQRSRHVLVSQEQLTRSSSSLLTMNWHLCEGSRMLRIGFTEIYSRGQNPQDWHLAKRDCNDERARLDDIYMKIGRKEASLVDADNEISAALQRYVEL